MSRNAWTVSPSPFLRTRPTLLGMSVTILLTLVPQLILLAFTRDYRALLNVALSVTGCVLAELCRGSRGRVSMKDGTIFVSGILTGLLLPEGFMPVLIPMVAFTGTLFARAVFGGTGSYWINPVAVSVAIAWISKPDAFPMPMVTIDGMRSMGEAFGAVKLDNFKPLMLDSPVTASFNRLLSAISSVRIPEGYATLFIDSPSVIPAFRFNLVVLIASIILIASDAIDWILPASFLATYAIALRFLSFGLPISGAAAQGDILFGFLTGGLLFTAFYLLPEYATAPRTVAGKVVAGIFGGFISLLLCGPGGTPVGSVFTVMSVNAISPLIEYAETRIPLSIGGRT